MEFTGVKLNQVLTGRTTVLDAQSLVRVAGKVAAGEALRAVVDGMGQRSAKAQKLPTVITTYGRLQASDNRLYILAEPESRKVYGILKVGKKKLFIRGELGQINEMTPLCVLDFYTHESCQRKGYGKELFETMLEMEGVEPHRLGYDKPSHKLLKFLAKHYGLRHYIPQENNFVVYQKYFEGPTEGGRASKANLHDHYFKTSARLPARPGAGLMPMADGENPGDFPTASPGMNAQYSTPNKTRSLQASADSPFAIATNSAVTTANQRMRASEGPRSTQPHQAVQSAPQAASLEQRISEHNAQQASQEESMMEQQRALNEGARMLQAHQQRVLASGAHGFNTPERAPPAPFQSPATPADPTSMRPAGTPSGMTYSVRSPRRGMADGGMSTTDSVAGLLSPDRSNGGVHTLTGPPPVAEKKVDPNNVMRPMPKPVAHPSSGPNVVMTRGASKRDAGQPLHDLPSQNNNAENVIQTGPKGGDYRHTRMPNSYVNPQEKTLAHYSSELHRLENSIQRADNRLDSTKRNNESIEERLQHMPRPSEAEACTAPAATGVPMGGFSKSEFAKRFNQQREAPPASNAALGGGRGKARSSWLW